MDTAGFIKRISKLAIISTGELYIKLLTVQINDQTGNVYYQTQITDVLKIVYKSAV
jgi:hypothetical protein